MTSEFLTRLSRQIAVRHGRKTGWLRHHLSLMAYRLGGFRTYKIVDWRRVKRIVFVCRGNICRSPYAEARARSLGATAISFGLEADGKSPVEPAALRNALPQGLDLSNHRSETAGRITLGAGDLLIGMEPDHGRQLRRLANRHGAQVTILGLWNTEPRPYIQDPFGLSDDYFQTCFDFIDASVAALISRMKASDDRIS